MTSMFHFWARLGLDSKQYHAELAKAKMAAGAFARGFGGGVFGEAFMGKGGLYAGGALAIGMSFRMLSKWTRELITDWDELGDKFRQAGVHLDKSVVEQFSRLDNASKIFKGALASEIAPIMSSIKTGAVGLGGLWIATQKAKQALLSGGGMGGVKDAFSWWHNTMTNPADMSTTKETKKQAKEIAKEIKIQASGGFGHSPDSLAGIGGFTAGSGWANMTELYRAQLRAVLEIEKNTRDLKNLP